MFSQKDEPSKLPHSITSLRNDDRCQRCSNEPLTQPFLPKPEKQKSIRLVHLWTGIKPSEIPEYHAGKHNDLLSQWTDGEDISLSHNYQRFKSIVPKIILDPHHPPLLSLTIWVKLKIKYNTRDRKYFQNFTAWGRKDFMKDRAFFLDNTKETPKNKFSAPLVCGN